MNEHVFDELAAYSLNGLEPEERASVDEHLASCDLCRLELSKVAEAVSAIPLSLKPVAQPPGLKTRILLSARQQTGERVGEREGPFRSERKEIGAPTVRGRRPRPLSFSLVAGFAVLLFAVGIAVGNLLQTGTPPLQRYDRLVAKSVSAGDRVTALQPSSAGSSLILHLSVARTRTGRTSLIIGPTSSPAQGKIYQLWFIRGKTRPVSVAIFRPTTGMATVLPLPKSARGFSVGAMTVEPGPSGSIRPTSRPVALAQLS